MNPPAIGNIVVTSPILCIKAQTENPDCYISISNVSKKNKSILTNNAETNQSTQGPRKIQGVSKPIKTTCSDDTCERDQSDMPPQESSSQSIFDNNFILYIINSLFYRLKSQLFLGRNILGQIGLGWRVCRHSDSINLVKVGAQRTSISRTRSFWEGESLYRVCWSGQVMGFAAARLD